MSLLVIDQVSRLALTEEEAPYFELVALKEWDDPRYVGGPPNSAMSQFSKRGVEAAPTS